MLDATTAQQISTFHDAVIERLDDANFHIEKYEGGFALKDDYDLSQQDPAYGDNDPDNDDNGTADGDMPLAGADDLYDDRYENALEPSLYLMKNPKMVEAWPL